MRKTRKETITPPSTAQTIIMATDGVEDECESGE